MPAVTREARFDLDFPRFHRRPVCRAEFRRFPEDFIVTENLGVALSGAGEHLYLRVRKRGENTAWVAEQLAKYFGVRTLDIGYAGLKDRHAVTTQWFSVYLPKIADDDKWRGFGEWVAGDVLALEAHRHGQKLRRGVHQSNSFEIRLRNIRAVEKASEMDSSPRELLQRLQDRLAAVSAMGVPNYFGEQRFGRDGGNLGLASRWFDRGEVIRKRKLRGMIMSAARAYLFNRVLSQRVRDGSWSSMMDGEPLQEPTGPLWGRGRNPAAASLLELESGVLQDFAPWCDGLEHCGLAQERRALVQRSRSLQWRTDVDDSGSMTSPSAVLSFDLMPGRYATSLLREVAELESAV